MAVTVKSKREITLMREAGRILAEVHSRLGKAIEPGMSTLDIDTLGEAMIRSYGCVPNFLNYNEPKKIKKARAASLLLASR